jgi:acyl-CoA synthetase (AMP-forming)/AMP-acid ligase II
MSKGALGLLSAFWPEDTPRYAHIPLKTIGDTTIYPIALATPDRPAIVAASGQVTYGDLAARARTFGGALRARAAAGSRVAIGLSDPSQLLVAMFGAFDAGMLAFADAGALTPAALDAFSPALVVGDGPGQARFEEIMTGAQQERSGRADFRTPILAMAKPDGSGEVLHNHRTLVATSISVGTFYLMAEDISVILLEPPTNWYSLAMLLGAMHRGATVWAAWNDGSAPLPDRADYLVCGWNRMGLLLEDAVGEQLSGKIAAGLVVGVEQPFSPARRLRVGRSMRADVLTLLGRSDLGPILGSHPAWYLNDAVGIPLPNVDLRPLNPTDGEPLNIGWEVIDSAEIGVKSALAPAGGTMVSGWLRTGLSAQIDPTGLFFLLPDHQLRAV